MRDVFNKIFNRIIIWDHAIHAWVIKNQHARLKMVFRFITCFGSGITWIFLYSVIFLLGTAPIRNLIISIVIMELLGLLIIIISRNIIKRQRPIPYLNFLAPFPWHKNSFPSHHALRVSFLAASWGMNYPQELPPLICAAVTISFSRIYLQRHYLSDVLTGSFIGYLCAWFVLQIY